MTRPSRSVFVLCLLGLTVLLAGVAAADTAQIGPDFTSQNTANTSTDSGSGTTNTTEILSQNGDIPPIIVRTANSSNYLSPGANNVTQEQYGKTSIDVSGAVQSDSLRLQGAQTELELQEEFEGQNGDDIEIETLEQIETDVRAIERQYQFLFQRYSDGEIDQSALIREFARLGVLGQQYRDLIETAQDVGSFSGSVDLRYRNLPSEIALYPSPLISHIDSEFRNPGGTAIYLQGGDESLVVGTVVGDSYLRQAVLLDERDRTEPERFGNSPRSEVEEAFERARLLYPWTLGEGVQSEVQGFGDSSVYRVETSHSNGQFRAYLDGGTTNPFFEIQEKNPFAIPATDFTQTTDNDLRLSVESTAPTGPMRINVVNTQGSAQNLTIYIEGDPVETIQSGQSLWTVQPRGLFEVTVETESGKGVSVEVSSDSS